MKYDFKSIEKKWQDKWEQENAFRSENGGDKEKKSERDAIITLSKQIPHTQLEHINSSTPAYYILNFIIEK